MIGDVASFASLLFGSVFPGNSTEQYFASFNRIEDAALAYPEEVRYI